MSTVVAWRQVPVDPGPLGSAGHPLKGVLLEALGTDPTLGEKAVVERGGQVAVYLRGYRDGIPDDPGYDGYGLRADITEFLAHLDEHGSLLVSVDP